MAVDAVAPWAELVLFTAHDLAALPDDAWHYELVDGRLVRRAPTGLEHGGLGMGLASALRVFVDEHGLGLVVGAETGFQINGDHDPDTVLAPDAAFIAAERIPPKSSHDWIAFPRLAPDLVLEVGSPGQHRPEIAAKAKRWLSAGVRLVWIVWPRYKQIDVWDPAHASEPRTLTMADTLDGGDVVPGFTYRLARLWQ